LGETLLEDFVTPGAAVADNYTYDLSRHSKPSTNSGKTSEASDGTTTASKASTHILAMLPEVGPRESKRKGRCETEDTPYTQTYRVAGPAVGGSKVFNAFSLDSRSNGPWPPPEIAELALHCTSGATQHSATTSQGTVTRCDISWPGEPGHSGFAGPQSSAGVYSFSGQSPEMEGNCGYPYPPAAGHSDTRCVTYAHLVTPSQARSHCASRSPDRRRLTAVGSEASGLEESVMAGGSSWGPGVGNPGVRSQDGGRSGRQAGQDAGDSLGGLQGGQGISGVYFKGNTAGSCTGGDFGAPGVYGAYRVRSGGSRPKRGGSARFHAIDPSKIVPVDWLEPSHMPGTVSREVPLFHVGALFISGPASV
jgi:hypothetical protein